MENMNNTENNNINKEEVSLETLKKAFIDGLLALDFLVEGNKYATINEDFSVKVDVNNTLLTAFSLLELWALKHLIGERKLDHLQIIEGMFRYLTEINRYNLGETKEITVNNENDQIYFTLAVLQAFKISIRNIAHKNGMTTEITREEAIKILEENTNKDIL